MDEASSRQNEAAGALLSSSQAESVCSNDQPDHPQPTATTGIGKADEASSPQNEDGTLLSSSQAECVGTNDQPEPRQLTPLPPHLPHVFRCARLRSLSLYPPPTHPPWTRGLKEWVHPKKAWVCDVCQQQDDGKLVRWRCVATNTDGAGKACHDYDVCNDCHQKMELGEIPAHQPFPECELQVVECELCKDAKIDHSATPVSDKLLYARRFPAANTVVFLHPRCEAWCREVSRKDGKFAKTTEAVERSLSLSLDKKWKCHSCGGRGPTVQCLSRHTAPKSSSKKPRRGLAHVNKKRKPFQQYGPWLLCATVIIIDVCCSLRQVSHRTNPPSVTARPPSLCRRFRRFHLPCARATVEQNSVGELDALNMTFRCCGEPLSQASQSSSEGSRRSSYPLSGFPLSGQTASGQSSPIWHGPGSGTSVSSAGYGPQVGRPRHAEASRPFPAFQQLVPAFPSAGSVSYMKTPSRAAGHSRLSLVTPFSSY